MKRKVHILPVMSPCAVKNVISSLSGILPSSTAGVHHSVSETISPAGLMIAEMPVLAHLAMALRVSMALSLA